MDDLSVYLFDAAFPGEEMRDTALCIPWRPGRYQIDTAIYMPEPRTQLRLHRFTTIA